MKKILFLGLLLASGSAFSEPESILELDTVNVLGSVKKELDKPYSSRTMTDEQINNEYTFKSVPDSMRFNPGVMIQQSSGQQLSPYMRSFTGYRTDLYIDGIRVNNGIWREGPNQYFGTFDPFTVGNTEVTMGPGTVKYGSDALGGTLNIHSRDVVQDADGLNGRTVQRFNSADLSYVTRYEGSGKSGGLSYIFGMSPKWFNNVTDGHGTEQPHTGFNELDGDVKVNYDIDQHHSFTTLFQHYGSHNAWRVHNTIYATPYENTKPGDLMRRSFDEDRELGYVQYHGKNLGLSLADNIDVSFSVQSFNEPQWRNKLPNKSYIQSDRGMSDTTIGSFIKANKYDNYWGLFEYGVETYQDTISSWNTELTNNKGKGPLEIEQTFGPVANNSTYGYTSAYFQNTFSLISDKLDLVSGGRYTNVVAHVGPSEDASSPNGEFAPYNRSFNFGTGSGRLLWHIDDEKHWDSWAGVSSGARAPTIFDLSGDEVARSYEVQTPNPNIKPEQYLTYETGVKTSYKNFSGSLVYYYNDIQDIITRVPTGKIIDGDYQVVAKNGGHGHNQGIELSTSWAIIDELTGFGYFNWQDSQQLGYKLNDPSVSGMGPMSRMTPINGMLGLRYTDFTNKWWVQTDIQMFAAQHRLSYDNKFDRTRIPTPYSPGYVLPTLRLGYDYNKNINFNASVSNMSNTYYRGLGSGMNGAGVSGLVQVDIKF